MDSRGRGLEPLLQEKGLNVHVNIASGAGIEGATTRAMPLIDSVCPMLITVGAGICNITQKHYLTKEVRLRVIDVKCAINDYEKSMQGVYNSLTSRYPHTTVNFATIFGIDLADYNTQSFKNMDEQELDLYYANKQRHPEQDILNNQIITTNIAIQKYNATNQVATPWTSKCIHKYYKGTYHHNYFKLIDGCHPNEEALHNYAVNLLKSIKKVTATL